ncbi:MAG: hypothetical protein RMJ33_05750 [Saprospiraceae bacterium]|nr:hypothetical protein [Saprospiraceae bacterium]MDW8229323.1 hypothetical protein [Saprospiraceae bacterium]
MRKRWTLLIGALGLGGAVLLSGQKLPHHNQLLFSLNQRPDSLWHLFAPRFLTAFNPTGYNNQPQFFSSYEIYLTAQLPTDTAQTDIYALDLLLNTITRVTATTTPEYSPTRMPDGKHFSVVRVEADSIQRLWALPIDRRTTGYPLLPEIKGVGYHCWLRDTLLALFLVGNNDSHTLAMVNPLQPTLRRIAVGIGRCLQKTADGRLAFVQKLSPQEAFLKVYDPLRGVVETLTQMPEGTEDFAPMPDGAYLAGEGSRLLQFHPRRQNGAWTPIADLSPFNVRKISRIAVSPDGRLLVVVVQ